MMDKDMLYKALLSFDGYEMQPDWPAEKKEELTTALDELRLALLVRDKIVSEETWQAHQHLLAVTRTFLDLAEPSDDGEHIIHAHNLEDLRSAYLEVTRQLNMENRVQ